MHLKTHGWRGFSLIEVMVTLVLLSVGLLGVAKLQAASMSNLQVSRARSLIALQAESLAAAMHANPAYWATGNAPASFTLSGATVTATGGLATALATGACQGQTASASACTSSQIAARDVQNWASNLSSQIPGYTSTVSCSLAIPIACQITLTWPEKVVATNTTTAGGTQPTQPSLTLFVAP